VHSVIEEARLLILTREAVVSLTLSSHKIFFALVMPYCEGEL
jgi:hypothetical protein